MHEALRPFRRHAAVNCRPSQLSKIYLRNYIRKIDARGPFRLDIAASQRGETPPPKTGGGKISVNSLAIVLYPPQFPPTRRSSDLPPFTGEVSNERSE